MDMESKQVTEASSNALQEIYDGLSAMPTSDVIMPSNRRVNIRDEIINIPEGVERCEVCRGVDVNNQMLR